MGYIVNKHTMHMSDCVIQNDILHDTANLNMMML